LSGPWYQVSGYTFFADWDQYHLPKQVRHGAMIIISQTFDALVKRFGMDLSD
jgi:hypothetical protein